MPHIFISYSKQNRDYARKLTAKLLAEGFDVWIDERIDYGENWWNAILEAIKGSGAFIVIMTPESLGSRWVQREVTLADQWQKPAFPILVKGENWPIYVLTQYATVQAEALPAADFYERLAEVIPRSSSPGQEVAPPTPSQTPVSGQRRVPIYLLASVLVLIAIGVVFAASRILNSGTTTTTPSSPPTSITATSAPDHTPSSSPTDVPGLGFALQLTQNQVRVREADTSDALVVGILKQGDQVQSLESPAETAAKVGQQGLWIHIQTATGIEGYVNAATVSAVITGVNIDPLSALGNPDAARLAGIGWMRVKFNVSYNLDNQTFGNTDVRATCKRYTDYLQPYVNAGIRVIVVFTHQLFGEGADYNWMNMAESDWDNLIPAYADLARTAAQCLKQAGVVHAYQIWNEQDTPPAQARAAVPVPYADYAHLLTATIQSIRTVDTTTPIITGGFIGGTGAGVDYARRMLDAMPDDVRPDGIAFHAYGYGPSGSRFAPWGLIDEAVNAFAALMPDKPVWITEWGVLDFQGNESVLPEVTDYATGFLHVIQTKYPDKVAAAVWYAWADGMDNGYGLVDQDDQPKTPLYNVFVHTS